MSNQGSLMQKMWHCPSYDRLHLREWEDEFFLFDAASGDTHLLNALSMAILSLLKQRRLSVDGLIEKLPEAFGAVESPIKRDQLTGYLQQFEEMGLIVSSRSCD